MKNLTFGRKYKPKTMEKRELVHMDDVMEYLDVLKSWEIKEIQAKCVVILLYIHKNFDISKPDLSRYFAILCIEICSISDMTI